MTYPTPQPPKRLTRSRDDKVLAGVCGGLARYANLDPALVRILAVVLTLLTGGDGHRVRRGGARHARGGPGGPAAATGRAPPAGLAFGPARRPRLGPRGRSLGAEPRIHLRAASAAGVGLRRPGPRALAVGKDRRAHRPRGPGPAGPPLTAQPRCQRSRSLSVQHVEAVAAPAVVNQLAAVAATGHRCRHLVDRGDPPGMLQQDPSHLTPDLLGLV